MLTESNQECIGFTIHGPVPTAPAATAEPRELLGAAVERIAARLGHLSLPDVLREVAALVERQAIEPTARRCDGDAATAGALGVSAASLRRRRRRLAGQGRETPAAAVPDEPA